MHTLKLLLLPLLPLLLLYGSNGGGVDGRQQVRWVQGAGGGAGGAGGVVYAAAPQERGAYAVATTKGRYNYGYNTGDGIAKVEVRQPDGSIVGSYRYFDPTGKQVVRSYVADKRGFRVLGNDLPISPDTPASHIAGTPAFTGAVEGTDEFAIPPPLGSTTTTTTSTSSVTTLQQQRQQQQQHQHAYRQQLQKLEEQKRQLRIQEQKLVALQRDLERQQQTIRITSFPNSKWYWWRYYTGGGYSTTSQLCDVVAQFLSVESRLHRY
ncbi:hypothetical protein Pmani_020564 [Petrolisthes manimaculis]|uniref:Cuticle protein 6 n=1 Tax=Petrolisthes manimaculis TaxID=1843537 RepID=A0AAE1PIG1_9EUCA|nr:hypothetical protein Pmani_020564 [Petrolisthes manimaculis]